MKNVKNIEYRISDGHAPSLHVKYLKNTFRELLKLDIQILVLRFKLERGFDMINEEDVDEDSDLDEFKHIEEGFI